MVLLAAGLFLAGVNPAEAEENAKEGIKFNSPVHHLPCTGDCIPFYAKGAYHLFILKDGGWQHLRSTDLLNWKELPMALTKGKPGDADADFCFTGHIMEHKGVFHIFYPGVSAKHPKGAMQMMHATSKDLIKFTKHPKETWGPDGINYKTKAQTPERKGHVEWPTFKDQCIVWNEKQKKWWMFLSAQMVTTTGPACGLAVSDDLIHWTQVPPIKGLPTGDCTDIFKIGNWWYRISNVTYWRARNLAGPWSKNNSGQGYEFDTEFLLVPKRLYDGKRHILIGGMRYLYGSMLRKGKMDWHCTSIPREIYADADGFLCTRPMAEATALFTKTVLDLAKKPKFDTTTLKRAWMPPNKKGPDSWKYDGDVLTNHGAHSPERAHCSFDAPADYMLTASVQLDHRTVFTVGFREQPGKPRSGYKLVINRRTSEVEINSPTVSYSRRVKFDPHKPVTVQAFVIASIMECWVNDAYAFSLRDCDFLKGKLSFEAVGGRARIKKLTVKTTDH